MLTLGTWYRSCARAVGQTPFMTREEFPSTRVFYPQPPPATSDGSSELPAAHVASTLIQNGGLKAMRGDGGSVQQACCAASGPNLPHVIAGGGWGSDAGEVPLRDITPGCCTGFDRRGAATARSTVAARAGLPICPYVQCAGLSISGPENTPRARIDAMPVACGGCGGGACAMWRLWAVWALAFAWTRRACHGSLRTTRPSQTTASAPPLRRDAPAPQAPPHRPLSAQILARTHARGALRSRRMMARQGCAPPLAGLRMRPTSARLLPPCTVQAPARTHQHIPKDPRTTAP